MNYKDAENIIEALREEYEGTDPVYFFARTLFNDSANIIEFLEQRCRQLEAVAEAAKEAMREVFSAVPHEDYWPGCQCRYCVAMDKLQAALTALEGGE